MVLLGSGRGRMMNGVELYARVRYAAMRFQIEGVSRREAARRIGIDPRTVAKMLAFSVPPGYRRSRPPARPKLDPLTGIIDAILATDERRPKKQRHTTKRIFERLRDEHGYTGGIGEALAEIAGVERKIHFIAIDLSHCDACFVRPIRRRPPRRSATGTTARCPTRSSTTTPR